METETHVIRSYAELISAFGLGVIAFALALESLIPRRATGEGLRWRWSNNFLLSTFNWFAVHAAATWFYYYLSLWAQLNLGWGFNISGVPQWLQFLALLLLTQFLSYWAHRAFHRVPLLWKLHAVHHSDTEVDASTTYRNHPLEPIVTMPIMAPAVLLLGISPEATLAYRLFDVVFQVFSHSNIRIPEHMERYLRWVILTPDFHRTHHIAERRYTDSNYGSLVPWFDYLFGTARTPTYDSQETARLGLEYLRQPRDSRLDQLLLMPLKVRGEQQALREEPTARGAKDKLTEPHPATP